MTPTKRTFVSTPNLWKKGSNKTSKVSNKKGASKEDDEALDQERPAERDPNDFSKLEAGITKALERLKNNLSKLHTGGRFNPDILANVRVHLEKGSKTSIRLGDLAQVLPKGGRSVIVLVSEKDVSADQCIKVESLLIHSYSMSNLSFQQSRGPKI